MDKGIINLNELLKKEYNYSQEDNILNQDFTEIEIIGKREKFRFKFKNKQYLYKKQEENANDLYNELIAKTLADTLKIDCAKYYPATFNDSLGVITENFLKEDEQLILGVDIISTVLNKYFLHYPNWQEEYGINDLSTKDANNKLNTLEDIWTILDLYFIDYPNRREIVGNILDGLVKMLIFDILTIQGDRHIENWGIIKNRKTGSVRLTPLYDNSNIYGLNRKSVAKTFNNMYSSLIKNTKNQEKTFEQLKQLLYHSKLVLSVSEKDIIDIHKKKRKNNLEVIDNFLKISSKEYTYMLLQYLEIIDNKGMDYIIKECEDKYKIEIPNDIKEHYIKASFLNNTLVREKIEEYLNRKESENERRYN